MRTIQVQTICAMLVVAMLWGPASADAGTLAVSVEGSRAFGSVSYDLYGQTEAGVGISSSLVFPLGAYRAGADVAYAASWAPGRSFEIRAFGSYQLTRPSDPFLNTDWEQPVGWRPVTYSYTESAVAASLLTAGARVSVELAGSLPATIHGVFGYDYLQLQHTALGYDGWQYYEGYGGYGLARLDSTDEAIRYELWSHTLLAGVSVRAGIGSALSVETLIAYAPVYAHDSDDHIVRNRIATAEGYGHGAAGELEIRYRPEIAPGGLRLFLAGVLAGRTYFINTAQHQRWYADDPGVPGDQTGDELTVGHRMLRLSWDAGVRLGVEFPLGAR